MEQQLCFEDLKFLICQYLPVPDVFLCAQVCKSWYHAIMKEDDAFLKPFTMQRYKLDECSTEQHVSKKRKLNISVWQQILRDCHFASRVRIAHALPSAHTDEVRCVAWNNAGTMVASGSADQTVVRYLRCSCVGRKFGRLFKDKLGSMNWYWYMN